VKASRCGNIRLSGVQFRIICSVVPQIVFRELAGICPPASLIHSSRCGNGSLRLRVSLLCSNALCSKSHETKGERTMKKLALGIATAAVLVTAAAPAMAQVGFYAGPRGFGVDIGAPYYGYGYYPYNGYYDYYNGPYYGGPSVVIRGGHWHGHHYWRH
jgi:hypothetical protein